MVAESTSSLAVAVALILETQPDNDGRADGIVVIGEIDGTLLGTNVGEDVTKETQRHICLWLYNDQSFCRIKMISEVKFPDRRKIILSLIHLIVSSIIILDEQTV